MVVDESAFRFFSSEGLSRTTRIWLRTMAYYHHYVYRFSSFSFRTFPNDEPWLILPDRSHYDASFECILRYSVQVFYPSFSLSSAE